MVLVHTAPAHHADTAHAARVVESQPHFGTLGGHLKGRDDEIRVLDSPGDPTVGQQGGWHPDAFDRL